MIGKAREDHQERLIFTGMPAIKQPEQIFLSCDQTK